MGAKHERTDENAIDATRKVKVQSSRFKEFKEFRVSGRRKEPHYDRPASALERSPSE